MSLQFQLNLIDTQCFVFQQNLDVATEPWGVKVERVEVKDVRVPEQLQRAMAAEAEAAREARAKVIAAEGEHKASRALRQAAEVIVDSPAALQLRYLQTLNSISAENNSTIVFPVPIDIMSSFMTGSTSTNPFTLTGSYEVKCLPLNLTVLLYCQVDLWSLFTASSSLQPPVTHHLLPADTEWPGREKFLFR